MTKILGSDINFIFSRVCFDISWEIMEVNALNKIVVKNPYLVIGIDLIPLG